jgi:hypothetical protein
MNSAKADEGLEADDLDFDEDDLAEMFANLKYSKEDDLNW